MRCQRAQQRLMAYHDSELSSRAMRRIDKHLDSCRDCSRLLEDLRLADEHASKASGVNEVVGVPEMPPPSDMYWNSFTARVMDRVEEDAATRVPDRHRASGGWNLFIPRMAPAFSIVLVVVVAAGVMMKMGGPDPGMKAPFMEETVETAALDSVPEDETSVVTMADNDNRQAAPQERNGSPVVEKQIFTGKEPSKAPPAAAVKKQAAREAVIGKSEAAASLEATGRSDEDGGSIAVEKPAGHRSPASAPYEENKGDLSDALSRSLDASEGFSGKAEEVKELIREKAETVHAEDSSTADLADRRSLEEAGTPREEGPPAVVAAEADRIAEAGDAAEDIPAEPQTDERVETAGETAASEAGKPLFYAAEPADPAPAMEQGQPEDASLISSSDDAAESGGTAKEAYAVPAGAASGNDAKRTVSSSLPYRGPEEQLTHAKSLADVRKFWESEQVLKDLISQQPPSSIQEEASLLLVRVLTSQNRMGEARQTLDDAKVQFPANERIQAFDLGTVEEKPVQ